VVVVVMLTGMETEHTWFEHPRFWQQSESVLQGNCAAAQGSVVGVGKHACGPPCAHAS
jgi:hypothetical protein